MSSLTYNATTNSSPNQKKVGQLKKKLTTSKLVKDLPTPMTHFLAYLTTLGFESKPDYDYVHRLLEGMFSGSKQPKNVRYDWEMLDGEAVASDASQKEVVPVKFDASIVQKHMENVSIEENINGGMDATPATAKPTEAGPELRPRPPLITRGILRMFR